MAITDSREATKVEVGVVTNPTETIHVGNVVSRDTGLGNVRMLHLRNSRQNLQLR